MTDANGNEIRPSPGPLARVGQSDSFAGLARIGIFAGGLMIAWASFDFRAALDDIHQNQKAIIALADRTTHVEDTTGHVAESLKEFRLYTESQINALNSDLTGQSQRINEIDRGQAKTLGRVQCLENHARCPQ